MKRSTDHGGALEILMVHDNPADVGLTIESLDEEGVRHHVSVVEDGREALAFLRRGRSLAKSPGPDLILLDLDMTRMNGHEFLEAMRGDPDLKEIPVVVFSHSDTPVDRTRSDALGALQVKEPPRPCGIHGGRRGDRRSPADSVGQAVPLTGLRLLPDAA